MTELRTTATTSGRASIDPPGDGVAGATGAPFVGLVVTSLLALYFELVAIRWLTTEIRYFAYYKNLPLMACFLGLGIGFARADREEADRLPGFLPAFSLLGLFLVAGSSTFLPRVLAPPSPEGFLGFRATSIGGQLAFYALVTGTFAALTLTFVPLGQAVGLRMRGMPTLRAYSLNVVGSLLGIVAMTALGFSRTHPGTWYGLGAATCLALLVLRSPRVAVPSAIAVALLVIGLAIVPTPQFERVLWSPYSKIEVQALVAQSSNAGVPPLRYGTQIRANHDYFQKAIDLSDGFIARYGAGNPILDESKRAYELPYAFRHPGKVLILGAGMGNDVAAALRRNADEVVAVELDPDIQRLGRELHPEHPYADPRVRPVIEDARAFIRRTDESFDTIAYGLLDSHSMLSALSAVRVDNFVYTVEALREAVGRLRPGGIVSLTFAIDQNSLWLRTRLVDLMHAALGKEPVCFEPGYDRGFTVVGGPGIDAMPKESYPLPSVDCRVAAPATSFAAAGVVPTDDWPFLYLPRRSIPTIYLWVLIPIAAVTFLISLLTLPRIREVDLHFFSLGAGFLLIETKAITDLALLLGTTWVVNSVAFAAVLLMILAGNALVQAVPRIGYRSAYALLGVAILLNWLAPHDLLLSSGYWTRGVVRALIIALPLAFAAILFARSVSASPSLAAALGSNLLGAMVGGLLEYASMALGFRALWMIALVVYAISALALGARRRVVPVAS